MTLVTNDQPLALEGASVGIEALSRQQLFAAKCIAMSPPTNLATSTEAREGGERAREKERERSGACEKTGGIGGGKSRGRNGDDISSGIGSGMAGVSLAGFRDIGMVHIICIWKKCNERLPNLSVSSLKSHPHAI